jgi:enoyl-[acyl-carrier protein] reductase I
MGFMSDKKVLITGMLSNRSIAYGIAKAMHREGAALAFTFQGEGVKDRVTALAAEFSSDLIFPCDVTNDEQIDSLFADLGKRWDGLDGIVHSIAFAPREALSGDYLDSITRDAFRVAHDISLQLRSARKRCADDRPKPLCPCLSGAERSMPNYNVMGAAKAKP